MRADKVVVGRARLLEEVPGLSFVAYRRTYTMLHVPALGCGEGKTQVFSVDKEELEVALKADLLTCGSTKTSQERI